MKIYLLIILFLSHSIFTSARSFESENKIQFKQTAYELSVFNNGTFMPGKGALGIWSRTLHPGISVGKRFYYQQRAKSQLFQTAKFGYFYHRHAQHGFQLYTELGYRYKFTPDFFAEANLGIGYLHSVPALQVFELKESVYKKPNRKSRHQFMGSLALKVGYNLQATTKLPMDVFVGYQFWVQSPFVNKYVPVLPNNSVHLGAIYYFKRKIN